MFLSAINALTLSPALCGVLLQAASWAAPRHHRQGHARDRPRARRLWRRGRPHRALFGHRPRDGRASRRRHRRAGEASRRPASCPRTIRAPSSSSCRLPGGASVGRTADVDPAGRSDPEGGARGRGLHLGHRPQLHRQLFAVQCRLHRRHAEAVRGAQGAVARRRRRHRPLGAKFRQIQGGTVVPLAPPPIIGLGTGGGFAYVLQDLRGGDPKALAQVVRGLVVAANQDPQLTRVFSTFSATNPSIYLDIDRDKAQILGVPLNSRLPGAAGLARRLLRQRHESVRPHLAGPGPGRGRRPRQHRRHLPHQRAQRATAR